LIGFIAFLVQKLWPIKLFFSKKCFWTIFTQILVFGVKFFYGAANLLENSGSMQYFLV